MPDYKNFYRYSERELMKVRAKDLQAGDYITLSGQNLKYGIILIEDVTRPRGVNFIAIDYDLPVGAVMSSKEDTEISVFWNQGPIPIVQVHQTILLNETVLILKR